MATLETQQLDEIIVSTRRKMLTKGGAALAALAFGATATPKKAEAQAVFVPGDSDILNFALNLEYLEAQYYNLAVYGVTIDQLSTPIPISINGTTGGTVTLSPSFAKVPFTNPLVQAFATETATIEGKHVLFLQNALGAKALSMPNIDLFNSFNAFAAAANIAGGTFNPFDTDADFLIGAYIFEDVGVSAYGGALATLTDKVNNLPAAVGIHAVEAYHAGFIRTTINALDGGGGTGPLSTLTQMISAARSAAANPDPTNPITTPFVTFTGSAADDIGVSTTPVALNTASANITASTIVDCDLNSQGWARNTSQILAIVTLTTPTATVFQGGFFPKGLNGAIS